MLFSKLEGGAKPPLASMEETWQLAALIFLVAALIWAVFRFLRGRRSSHTLKLCGHRWKQCEFSDKPTYCSSCATFCLQGGRMCDTCGACVCPKRGCLRSTSRTLACKSLSFPASSKMTHQWARGNLPLSSKCRQCFAPCGDVPRLADYRCLWCGVTVHEECFADGRKEGEEDEWRDECSLGPHCSLIIPPNCVTMGEEGWRGRRRVVVKELRHPPACRKWRPVIVLANPKSGGRDGEVVIGLLRRLLNPVQVGSNITAQDTG